MKSMNENMSGPVTDLYEDRSYLEKSKMVFTRAIIRIDEEIMRLSSCKKKETKEDLDLYGWKKTYEIVKSLIELSKRGVSFEEIIDASKCKSVGIFNEQVDHKIENERIRSKLYTCVLRGKLTKRNNYYNLGRY